MRKTLVSVSLVLAVWLLASMPMSVADDASTKAFFNGKDFTGWEGLIKDFWSIKDGALVGHSAKPIPFNTFLCSTKKYGDFELKFEVEIKDGEGKSGVQSRNSGIQVRSEVFNEKQFAVKGPQCDMGGPYWGSLYGEHFGGMMQAAPKDVVAKALKTEGFNNYYIKCVGKHVTIKLNGQTTVDGDFPKAPDTGIIAWQLHSGGPMTITFRNIQFTDLSKAK